MKPKIPFYYHLLLFLGLLLLNILWDIGIDQNPIAEAFKWPTILFSISYMLATLFTYTINFYTFCHWFLNRKRIFFYLLMIPVILLLFAGIRYVIEEVIIYNLTGAHNYGENTRKVGYYIRDNFFYGLPAWVISTFSYLFWQFQAYQKINQELLLENQKAQLHLLKAQVSPHFLFNTLNSFYSDLALRDPNTAADLLILSDLLRYVITENDKETTSLSKEIDFIKNYILLQEKRFENQLFLDFTVQGTPGTQMLLPAVLIHFVENVFKHAILNQRDKPGRITIKIGDNQLEIHTVNTIARGEQYDSTGIGFNNLSKRLEYYYKDNFILEKKQENDIFTTYLKIPLNQDL